MKVVTYNIRYGLGLDQRYDLERVANTVSGADIIAFQEVERFWRRSGMTDQPKLLGKLLNEYYWVYYPAFDVDASTRSTQDVILNRRRQFGPMLMSKWPILSSRLIQLPMLTTHTQLNLCTGVIEGIISTPLGPVCVYVIHLSSISTRERLMQIDYLIEVHNQRCKNATAWSGNGRSDDPAEAENFIQQDWTNGENLPPEPKHTLFMGDFNSVEESAEYIRFAGEIDPLYGRGMHSDDLIDCWSITKQKTANPITWWPDPPDRAPGYGLRLDYCFVSIDLASRVSKAWVDVEANGSDHKPYWVEFC